MSKVALDIADGSLTLPSGATAKLDPGELALLYRMTFGMPPKAIATVLGCDEPHILRRVDALCTKLRLDVDRVASFELDFRHPGSPGPSRPWNDRTLAKLISRGLGDRDQDEPFLFVSGKGALSVREVAQIVSAIGQMLRKEGVGAGDVVAVDAALSAESMLASYAVWLQGAALLRIDPKQSLKVQRDILEIVPAKLVFAENVEPFVGREAPGRSIAIGARGTGHADAISFDDWLVEAHADLIDLEPAPVDPLAPCIIAPTSGSTGNPKTVAVSHLAFWFNSDRTRRYVATGSDSVFSSASDLISNVSTVTSLLMPLWSGGVTVIPRPDSRVNPIEFGLDCARAGVTHLMLVPSALRTLLTPDEPALRKWLGELQVIYSSTGPLGAEVMKTFRGLCSATLVDSIGMRECSGILVSATQGSETLINGGGWPAEALCRVVRPDGTKASIGEVGEIYFVSGSLMNGYWSPDGIRSSAYDGLPPRPPLFDDWFASGDLGRYREDGRIEIVGRSRDVIKTPDGQLLMPIEVERVLDAFEGVTESCVFAVHEPDGTERIGAAVISAGGADSKLERRILAEVNQRLGHLRTPCGIMIMDSFPRVGRAKIDKNALVALFQEQRLTRQDARQHREVRNP